MTESFRHRIRVRYSECDLQGVVFNANYLTYMDEAITELWRVALTDGYAGMVEAGVDLVVAEAHVRYLVPARFDQHVEIDVRITRLGITGMTTELTIRHAGRTLTQGTLRHVFVAAGQGHKTPIPDAIRVALEPFTASASPGSAR